MNSLMEISSFILQYKTGRYNYYRWLYSVMFVDEHMVFADRSPDTIFEPMHTLLQEWESRNKPRLSGHEPNNNNIYSYPARLQNISR
jgi:hypothetical protein